MSSYRDFLAAVHPRNLHTVTKYLDSKLENPNLATTHPSTRSILTSQAFPSVCLPRSILVANAAELERFQLKIDHQARTTRRNIQLAVEELRYLLYGRVTELSGSEHFI